MKSKLTDIGEIIGIGIIIVSLILIVSMMIHLSLNSKTVYKPPEQPGYASPLSKQKTLGDACISDELDLLRKDDGNSYLLMREVADGEITCRIIIIAKQE